MKTKVSVEIRGLENATESKFDSIYFAGVTHPFLSEPRKYEMELDAGEAFEETFYRFHNEYELASIEAVDMLENPVSPKGMGIAHYERPYKDLYWFYSRNQDYFDVFSFVVPSYPLKVIVTYKRGDSISRMHVDLSKIGDILYKDDLKANYLYCYEETYNCARHYFAEGDIYFYPLGSSMTFAITLKRKANIKLRLEDKTFSPSEVRQEDGRFIYTFGSLDEMDDDDFAHKGNPIYLDSLDTEAVFFIEE